MLSYFLKSKTKTKTRKKRPNGCQDKKTEEYVRFAIVKIEYLSKTKKLEG